MMRSKISNMESGPTSSPVSSRNSLRSPSSSFSPTSRIPPGSDQNPFSGSFPLSTKSISRPSPCPRNTSAPTPSSGRSGYRRLSPDSLTPRLPDAPSLILHTPFNLQPNPIYRASRSHVQRLQIGVAKREVRRRLGEQDLSRRRPVRIIDENLFRGEIKVALFVRPQAAGNAFDT